MQLLKFFSGINIPGTARANKALILGPTKNVDTIDVTAGGLKLGGAAVTATATELNGAAAASRVPVVITATLAITAALHAGRTCLLQEAGGNALVTLTLPAATGSGDKYRFVVTEVNTSNYVIKSVVGTDLMEGNLLMVCDGGDSVEAFESGATDDTITLNGTTTGGAAIGDWIELEDISATGWAVRGVLTGTGDEVTPFSDTVA